MVHLGPAKKITDFFEKEFSEFLLSRTRATPGASVWLISTIVAPIPSKIYHNL
jgi:hypothetical protein